MGYGTPLGTMTYTGVGVSAYYVGKGYSQTYFGVTPAGAVASGLPASAVSDSGFKNVRLSTYAMQILTGHLLHGLSNAAGVSYSRMHGNYSGSPIVADARYIYRSAVSRVWYESGCHGHTWWPPVFLT